jgi:hypothetical protein
MARTRHDQPPANTSKAIGLLQQSQSSNPPQLERRSINRYMFDYEPMEQVAGTASTEEGFLCRSELFSWFCSRMWGSDMVTDDRRVRRTHKSLHNALVSLVLEKSYASVTVQDILDRADVGR